MANAAAAAPGQPRGPGANSRMRDFVGAIDQGTTSTRFFVFDHDARVVAHQQLEHSQLLPRPGWVEHDPLEILERVRTVMRAALAEARLTASDLAALGITNQRETTVVWDRLTGLPYTNAIVWQDVRTDRIVSGIERDGRAPVVRERTGLPPATYFSAAKIQWILQNVDAAREGAAAGTACSGTIDSWLLWNLTGGPKGGRHITDVTNASRTMLMDLGTLSWDDELLDMFAVPRHVLPEIRPSTGIFGDIFPEGTGKAAVPLTARPGRPACGHDRPGVPEPGRGQEHLWDGQFPVGQHGDRDREVQERPSQHAVLPDGRTAGGLCAGGVGSRDGCGRAMAPGPARGHKQRLRGRDPGRGRRRLRWCLFRPGLLRPFRPVLALGRPRHDRGPDTCQHQGPLWPGPPSKPSVFKPGTWYWPWRTTSGAASGP